MDTRTLVDDLLEISVVGSFTRIGPGIRRRLFTWPEPGPGALAGHTVLITGPTSGLGRVTAETVAALGARVVLVGRDPAKLGALRRDLLERHPEDRFPVVVADLGSLASVRAAVSALLSSEDRLDVLVDNAGAIGRLIGTGDLNDVADRGLRRRTRLFERPIRGEFLRGQQGCVASPHDVNEQSVALRRRFVDARIIVEFPRGYTPPPQGAVVNRDERRPYEITEVRKQDDGQLNVFVREIMQPK